MSTLLFANNAGSTLAGPISNVATTINLAAGGGALFPNPTGDQYFKLTLTDAATGLLQEIVHVTARSTDQLTVVRGQEGTTPRNWSAGDLAENLLTAGTMQAFLQGAGGGGPGFYAGQDQSAGANAVTVPTTTPSNIDPQAGQVFLITKNLQNNTDVVTLSVGGSAFKQVLYRDGSQLNPGDWPGGAAAWIYYNGTVYQFLACAGNIPANSRIHFGVDTGPANAIAATVLPPITTYSEGQVFKIRAAAAPTGATTANLGAGAKAVVDILNRALTGGEWAANSELILSYCAPQDKFQLVGILAASTLLNIQVITSSGNYTPTPGARSALIFLTGGGGGGGGAPGGGGGGGGTCVKRISLTGVSSIAITLGAGGAGATTGVNGNNGGNSSIASLSMTANGGVGGHTVGYAIGGAGGSATGGDLNMLGNQGQLMSVGSPVGGGGGGGSFWGGGGAGNDPNTSAAAVAGVYGGGGGGGYFAGTSAAGGNGVAVILEFA